VSQDESPKRAKLSTEQFDRVREIFDEACELPVQQREAHIAAQCKGDQAVRRAAMELLSLADVPESKYEPGRSGLVPRFLDVADIEQDALPEEFGPYRIKQMIGRGGMGVVYLATQSNPQREVALKLLRSGPTSHAMRSRFSREVLVLGKLDDPGIARIFEAGSQRTSQGNIAYFAMEYVDGPRLTNYAHQQGLDVRSRVELVAKVADALHHAHTKGVLHRDLKPANILVSLGSTATPATQTTAAANSETKTSATSQSRPRGVQPKILDFGVARLVEPDTQQTALTEAGLLIGTVAYMSPEQLSGDPTGVDTRSDIYSLGVVLYEVLSQKLPFDVLTKPIAEAARIIRDEPPAELTLSGQGRLESDLATIVAKAMSKDRERRYESAAAFAEDLRRYLRDEPIAARPPTVAYQFSKFARRNRALVAAVSAAALAVVGGLAVSLTLYMREQQARERADREASLSTAIRDYMIEGLLLAASPGRMGYEVKMLDVLEEAHKGLHERFKDHALLEAEVRWDLANVYEQLGKAKECLEQCELALPLVERESGVDSIRAVAILGHMSQASRRLQDPKKALELAEEAIVRAERGRFLANSKSTYSAHGQAGAALIQLNRPDEALSRLRVALAGAEKVTPPDEENILSFLTWIEAAERAKGNEAGALERTREIADRSARYWGRENEGTIGAKNNLVQALVKAGKLEEAAAVAAELPELAAKTFPKGHPGRAFCSATAAGVFFKVKKYPEAEKHALDAYAANVETYDDLNWMTERIVSALRAIYTDWGGHPERLRKWNLESARIRLMVSTADEKASVLKVVKEIGAGFEANGVTLDGGVVGLLWAERDVLAPPDHPRRAAFLANLATVMVERNERTHLDEAMALSRAALEKAHDRAVVERILSSLK
jgi:serine/threonine protein kinase